MPRHRAPRPVAWFTPHAPATLGTTAAAAVCGWGRWRGGVAAGASGRLAPAAPPADDVVCQPVRIAVGQPIALRVRAQATVPLACASPTQGSAARVSGMGGDALPTLGAGVGGFVLGWGCLLDTLACAVWWSMRVRSMCMRMLEVVRCGVCCGLGWGRVGLGGGAWLVTPAPAPVNPKPPPR